MKIAWLGQAGYRITTDNGTVIMIDPYMSDSLHEAQGESYVREVPIDEDVLRGRVDVLIISHCHADHMDFGTLDTLLAGGAVNVLCPVSVLYPVRNRYWGAHNYTQFENGIETIINGVRFSAEYAAHTDDRSIGVNIYADGRVITHTGDTMYHRCLKDAHPRGADALLLPVNGKGCNMNAVDAARLTKELAPKKVFPMHWDMFKAYGSDVNEFKALFADGEGPEIIIPEYYKDLEI